jgi:hypothetical protein
MAPSLLIARNMRLSPLLFVASLPAFFACGSLAGPGEQAGGTVTGKVVDLTGTPTGAAFQILVGDEVQTTGLDGSFSFANVPATYDIAVGWGNGAIVYKGMTTRSPVFHTPRANSVGQVPVQFSGLVDDTHRIAFYSASGSSDGTIQPGLWGGGNEPPTSVGFTYYVDPTSGAALPLTLHALTYEVDPTTNAVLKWTGHAELDDVHLDGAVPAWVVQPSPVETGSVSVSADAPPGIELAGLTLGVHLQPSDGSFSFSRFSPTTPSAEFLVPIVPGLTFDLGATGTTKDGHSSAWARAIAPGGTVVLELAQTPRALGPDEGSTGVTTETPFAFAPYDGGVQRVTFTPPESDPNFYSVQVVTTSSTITIPDLTRMGHPLPNGEAYSWMVERLPLGATVDEASSVPAIDSGAISYAYSTPRHFTTAR